MPRVEIEFDDKGDIVGEAPAPFVAYLERENTKVYGTAFKNGVSETQTKAAKQFEETLKAELAKKDALAPLERAKYEAAIEENKALSARITESITNGTKTLRDREEVHSREILARSEAVSARNKQIDALVASQLEGLAIAFGARDESLPELKVILKNYIGYTDGYEPFIKGEDGQPRVNARGERVDPKAFVKEYLDTHPHHRRPMTTGGGNARGGASLQGFSREAVGADAAKRRIHEGDRGSDAINDLFEATRAKRAG